MLLPDAGHAFDRRRRMAQPFAGVSAGVSVFAYRTFDVACTGFAFGSLTGPASARDRARAL